ncbi:MAG: HlyD family efflux transporter periplasmic adaptor subunit [Coxiellaceae bacterium]|jgi:HlyD family secretion protein|nr:HlyD family efflux transporter periplasmic adaptor subunit [Coxiellaceae bacterium]
MNILNKNKIVFFIGAIIVVLVGWFIGTLLWEPRNNKDFISGNGRIEATEVDIATKLGGRIDKILVSEGDFVKAGQVLVEMRTDTLQAELAEAKAKYQQTVNTSKSVAAQVTIRENELATSQALVRERESELEAAQKRLTRSRALSKKGAIALQTLDDDLALAQSAEAALSAAKAQVAAAESAIIATKAEFVGSQSAITAAEATVARIEVEIADSQIKSPYDGRVQYRIAEVGEILGSGGKILNLINLNDVYMTFFLPETVVGRVALGSEVRIILDAAPNYIIPAKVSYVASTAQFTPKTVETASERQKLMFRVKARINQKLLQQNVKQIKFGLPGVAWIKLNEHAEWPKNLAIGLQK